MKIKFRQKPLLKTITDNRTYNIVFGNCAGRYWLEEKRMWIYRHRPADYRCWKRNRKTQYKEKF